MKKVLILLFTLSIVLLGCSNVDKNEKNIEDSQQTSTESTEKNTRDFIVMIFDDTFKSVSSEVSAFSKGYFQPLYEEGRSIDFIGYIKANKQLRKAVETEITHMDDLEKGFDLTEYENQDEVSDILQLHMNLISSAKDYSLATENWITAEGEEEHTKYLDEAYNSLIAFGNKSEEYAQIIDKYNSEILPQAESGLNSENNSNDSEQSSYSKDELKADLNAPSTNPNNYNSNGEYKPVEDMTQEEIQSELEEILGDSLGQ